MSEEVLVVSLERLIARGLVRLPVRVVLGVVAMVEPLVLAVFLLRFTRKRCDNGFSIIDDETLSPQQRERQRESPTASTQLIVDEGTLAERSFDDSGHLQAM